MPFDLEFTLVQHTPLIHFQHAQPNAALRATEVKPKLDRFIIKKVGLRTCKQQGWLIGDGEQEALDYKLKFTNGPETKDIKLVVDEKNGKFFTDSAKYPLLLANMGGKESKLELKNFVMYDNLEVSIFSYHDNLIDKIKDNIALFFATNNFGNRQSKGFGSYFLKEGDPLYQSPKELLQNEFDKLVYWEFEDDLPFPNVFMDIDIINRLLKSGFNFPDHPKAKGYDGKMHLDLDTKGEFATYQRSFLMQHFRNEYKIGSEKREIKESLFRPQVRIKKDSSLIGNYYLRAILGTAGFFEYRDKERKGMVNIQSEEVDRFKSSITFKVFSNKTFIIPGDWRIVSNKKFVFATDRDKTKPIQSPSSDLKFDLGDFLFDFTKHFNGMKGAEIERLEDIVIESGRKMPKPIVDYVECLENVTLIPLNKSASQ